MFGRQGCQRCAACCQHTVVEADFLDALREPRIAAEGVLLDGHGTVPPDEASWCLNPPIFEPCVFLKGGDCTIYPTRPNACVAFEPGSDACCRARAAAGLLPLRPRHGRIQPGELEGIRPDLREELLGDCNSNYPAARAHAGGLGAP